jgi:hypothetical protein
VFGCIPAPNTAAPNSIRPDKVTAGKIAASADTLKRLASHTWYQHRTQGQSISEAWSTVVPRYSETIQIGVLPRVVSSAEMESIAKGKTQCGFWTVDITAGQSDKECFDALIGFGQQKRYLPRPDEMDTS